MNLPLSIERTKSVLIIIDVQDALMKKMNQVGHEPRVGLERGSYLLVIVGFIITLAIIWSGILEVIWSDIQERLVSYLF
mgnify:CR=1 FL=1